MNIIVTGGAGFIGSALIRYIINKTSHNILNLDKLTYAGNLLSLNSIKQSHKYNFLRFDICNRKDIDEIFNNFKPNLLMNLAAESHVDRSIKNSNDFINTNILGTYNLLEASRKYFNKLNFVEKANFRFHHISTDEVYGDLKDEKSFFIESTPYAPSSPYSASKASSDHLVRSWHRTYGLPIVITNCSNNYGPFQNHEKLIPHMIINALSGRSMPVYGKGNQIRDWLYVEDHVKALILVATKGKTGETYNIGGENEMRNIDVVEKICHLLEELHPIKPKGIDLYINLIRFVKDRSGHDIRYAIDISKIKKGLGWEPEETFDTGLKKTIKWYIDNYDWWKKTIKI